MKLLLNRGFKISTCLVKCFSVFSLVFSHSLMIIAGSDLDRIIPPEVKDDAFYQAIYKLAKTEALNNILEIGSSSGDGSTEAFVKGASENPGHPRLFCMELSKPRFAALQARYQHLNWVKCYNVSSVRLADFPQPDEVKRFMHQVVGNNLLQYGVKDVLRWLQQDIDYVGSAGAPEAGIELIKAEQGITNFDMVLIDGSEFTGRAEFKAIYGAKLILLDDICTFKNYDNYQQLKKDPNYMLITEDHKLRNGFAIFKRVQ